jgi:hypothetical protein
VNIVCDVVATTTALCWGCAPFYSSVWRAFVLMVMFLMSFIELWLSILKRVKGISSCVLANFNLWYSFYFWLAILISTAGEVLLLNWCIIKWCSNNRYCPTLRYKLTASYCTCYVISRTLADVSNIVASSRSIQFSVYVVRIISALIPMSYQNISILTN